jgi:hypothetical protein
MGNFLEFRVLQGVKGHIPIHILPVWEGVERREVRFGIRYNESYGI